MGGEEIDEEQQAGIEIADQAVHEVFEPEAGKEVSEEDVRFHQGLCAVGITTEALEEQADVKSYPHLSKAMMIKTRIIIPITTTN